MTDTTAKTTPTKRRPHTRKRPTVQEAGPHPVDVHVGTRVRLRRTMLGISQEKLGEAVGLTFQQIQKYERGANRIGSSRLFEFSRVLDVPVSFFFDDMPPELKGAKAEDLVPGGLANAVRSEPRRGERKLLLLGEHWDHLTDPHQDLVVQVAKSLATPATVEGPGGPGAEWEG